MAQRKSADLGTASSPSLLSIVFIFSLSCSEFPLGDRVSSHSPKTCTSGTLLMGDCISMPVL